MTPELGHYALILAFLVAVAQAVLPAVGYWRRDVRLLAAGATTAQALFLAVAVAYATLTWAFWRLDFSLAYVAANAHSELPGLYRLSAVWGAHEGSLLLWLFVLSGWALAVSVWSRRLPADVGGLTLAVLGAVAAGFAAFILFTSNPFERLLPVPEDGHDLNPVLQDPGLAIHPPVLYMGYVGFAVAFALAVAALITGRLDTVWARWARPWTTAAWACLTLGITLGSWWAYHELGWGGWWFWDPVENASFMPWLVGTALVHSLAVTEKRGLLKSWTVLLAILAFSLSLLGTFLVRSGVLVSVHAFAADPARGLFILGFLGVVVGLALALYAWRAPRLAAEGRILLWSREGLLLLNNLLLVVAGGAVLIGTLFPLAADALAGAKVSVGPPFFGAVVLPLLFGLVGLCGVGAVVAWKRARPGAARRLYVPAALAAVAGVAVVALWQRAVSPPAMAGVALGVFCVLASGLEWRDRARAGGWRAVPRSVWGMTLAHAGLGVWAIGVAVVASFGAEHDVRLGPGQTASAFGRQFAFARETDLEGPNWDASAADIRVDGRTRLLPQKRRYASQGMVMTESAVDKGVFRDVYVALGERIEGTPDWGVRLYYRPLMRWVWFGGVLMTLGGLVALSDGRYRVRRRLPAGALPGVAVPPRDGDAPGASPLPAGGAA